jgi:NhaA family Na+:H+ antiporter
VQWQHIFGAALIAGIGFTMSIFITQLAFTQEPDLINSSKMAVFTASVIAGSLGLLWLTLTTKKSTIIS